MKCVVVDPIQGAFNSTTRIFLCGNETRFFAHSPRSYTRSECQLLLTCKLQAALALQHSSLPTCSTLPPAF